jgi:hypothetical protein
LNFKDGDDTVKSIVSKLAFVPLTATLADARDRLANVKGAQDVIVTKTGQATEAAEGWLTNASLARG